MTRVPAPALVLLLVAPALLAPLALADSCTSTADDRVRACTRPGGVPFVDVPHVVRVRVAEGVMLDALRNLTLPDVVDLPGAPEVGVPGIPRPPMPPGAPPLLGDWDGRTLLVLEVRGDAWHDLPAAGNGDVTLTAFAFVAGDFVPVHARVHLIDDTGDGVPDAALVNANGLPFMPVSL